jgi:hypothetical protein
MGTNATIDASPGARQNLAFTHDAGLGSNVRANSPKGPFSYVAPAGGTGGGNLIFIDSTTLPNAQACRPRLPEHLRQSKL